MGFLSTVDPLGPSIGETTATAEFVQFSRELSVFGVVARVGALFQVGDGLVDATGVAADHPVDETGWLVEILGAGQQVGVLPDGVAGVGPDGLGQAFPQHCSLAACAA